MTAIQQIDRDFFIRQVQAALGPTGQAVEVRAQPDGFGRWNVAVVSECFEGRGPAERTAMLQTHLDGVELAWIDLLTPDEVAWAGALPADTAPERLPLWPEALAASAVGAEPPACQLPSDLDIDLPPPLIATFYSLRGGVGRSTALASAARILASRRLRVVCVDMDLEAPALPVLFGCDDSVQDNQGVVDLLLQLDQGDTPDFSKHLIPVSGFDDTLFVVPAGQISAEYTRRLRYITPDSWYREDKNPLRMLIDGFKTQLGFTPDVILFDARTDVTELNGPLLFELSDLAMIVLFPHAQAIRGTQLLTRGLLRTQTRRELPGGPRLAPEPRFILSPLPASALEEVKKRYERTPLSWIDDWLADFNRARERADLPPLSAAEITQAISYNQEIATRDRVGGDLAAFVPIADWVQQLLGDRRIRAEGASLASVKPQILKELSFSPGTAEAQKDLLRDFVETDVAKEALSPNYALVIGRKGTGKTALFRVLSEGSRDNIAVHSPAALRQDNDWQLSADGFTKIDHIIQGSDLQWRNFWSFYIALAARHHLDPAPREGAPSDPPLLHNEDAVTAAFARRPDPLEVKDWLRRLDAAAAAGSQLLFDGLDSGFGSDPAARQRRQRCVTGLFDCLGDLSPVLSQLKFKILLREDIWRGLVFDNKSHLHGNSVTLRWSDQIEFLQVVIRQAMR